MDIFYYIIALVAFWAGHNIGSARSKAWRFAKHWHGLYETTQKERDCLQKTLDDLSGDRPYR